ncbi:MAG TPA: tRNA lysidine(34) synthetase TilS, partial [Solirubrobacterales bacterium]|nr:tRNA lysidine(34) synthetase TilS [Solirubrobacterales bacterium]
ETGTVRFATGSAPVPDAVRLSVPGVARFGEWELRAELRPAPIDPADSRFAALDAASVGGELEVRAWQAGDRMRPLGLGGSKSLQDLFTDRGVPRSVRTRLPVVTAGGRVAWVAGVAVSDEFRLLEESTEVAVITARPAAPRP